VPSANAYSRRFGSLRRAYQLIGYGAERDYRFIEINRALRRLHGEIVGEVIASIERRSGRVSHDTAANQSW
jgi:hypothetical protein